jgi:hypothetical protein
MQFENQNSFDLIPLPVKELRRPIAKRLWVKTEMKNRACQPQEP